MSNRFQHIVQRWSLEKDDCEWVLATIIETKGSAYRKAGARMMINSFGQSYGLLSGGCLESDLMRQARKCWDTHQNHIVCYDMQDESDIAWQLGIGCGGMVKVLLQPINKANNYLDLLKVNSLLTERKSLYYYQYFFSDQIVNRVLADDEVKEVLAKQSEEKVEPSAFVNQIKPRPTITIFGGGSDAVPLVNMAKELGWYVTLIDSRTNYARQAYFKNADTIIKQAYDTLTNHQAIELADVIVIMNHNLELDAKALKLSEQGSCQYIGLLGPSHRTERVLSLGDISQKRLAKRLFNPVGLHLGGELPESIALAILAEAHAYVENGSMLPMKEHVKSKG